MPDKLARRQESRKRRLFDIAKWITLQFPEEREDAFEMGAAYEADQSRGGKVFESHINPGQQWKCEVCVSGEIQ